ncbi:MAG: class I SAM-dependent methyltransferase [Thermodesulfobacteriota bacterium]|nr:class I SAM-dependent methyltransferase [Thermodesulfobacteriota bacterium]
MNLINCRFCETPLRHTFADLGMSPLSNSYLKPEDLQRMEPFYPLHVYICENCYLIQLPEFEAPEHIFSHYAYFSSYSETWLNHARAYAQLMIDRFGFTTKSHVIEIASNDGYLLRYFKEKNIPVLGVEPAHNVAQVATAAGIPTMVKFFSVETAKELVNDGKQADLLVGNNVLAHVPDLNDFVEGMKIVLKPWGVITMEFPHLMRLMEENQFDTIYHEHFSYFSLITVEKVFNAHGLTLFDVEELSTHGGSLRIYSCHTEDTSKPVSERMSDILNREIDAGFTNLGLYQSFGKRVKETKRNILDFMIKATREGKSLVGYGAPAKGNTLFNYCGIGTDFINYTVDRSPYKQGHFLPGTHIPIYHPDKIKETKPDYLIILPWNLKDEIMEQMAHIRDWGGQFVTLIPEVTIYP